MIGLGLALPLMQSPRDSTPGGTTNVWVWEDGLGLLWEDDIFAPTE
jgi:hypothetical protein